MTLRHIAIAAVYGALLVLAIPWYWPADDTRLVFGLPLWALASLAVLAIIAILTAGLCLRDARSDE
ncbi:MAG: hypothetical protein AAGC71_09900 [Pseudomonadota bacterium]